MQVGNSQNPPEGWSTKLRKQTGAREARQWPGPHPKATQNPCGEDSLAAAGPWRPTLARLWPLALLPLQSRETGGCCCFCCLYQNRFSSVPAFAPPAPSSQPGVGLADGSSLSYTCQGINCDKLESEHRTLQLLDREVASATNYISFGGRFATPQEGFRCWATKNCQGSIICRDYVTGLHQSRIGLKVI